ncbi:MAG: DnaJ C-terminal domain-containing protein [Phaeovulum sp.]|uniref:DnaJ C-terminal domain-containing protein n=1 Tax=Phaeovulum sp. TaxID=2934796 RepID=UPI00273167A7|nr:DnaJ C-terminal domain-containing protein [Phaeovulum sp.]MDP2062609.1 DnaJ C-terminal domain-containing protein [Phaeovulum sp.]
MTSDPYAALGVTRSASAAEIKKAYRKIARSAHPDLNPDDKTAEARFKAASAAYDLLKDPETRARFDRGEIDASGAERAPRTYYRNYAEAPGNPYRGGQRAEDFPDVSDIFAEFLRQQGQTGSARSSQGFRAGGADMRYTMEVPFLDAVNGGSTRITLPDGSMLDVKIPAGTADGQTLRLRGKGAPGLGGGPAGDAYVTLTVRPHPLYRRDGNDILMSLPITIDEAVLGGKVEVPTPGGAVSVTIPVGASSGQTLRLRGRGVKSAGGGAGDLKLELRIVAPPKVDEALAEFLRDWRKTHAHDPRKGMRT